MASTITSRRSDGAAGLAGVDGAVRVDGGRGLGELLRELADGGAALVRHEVNLARREAGEIGGAIGRGTGWAGLGGVLLLLGALAACTGVIMLAGDQRLRDRFWLAALLITVVAGLAAAVLARVGMRHLAPSQLMPEETVESLKEDTAWLKRQLTSGATSS